MCDLVSWAEKPGVLNGKGGIKRAPTLRIAMRRPARKDWIIAP